MFCYSLQLFNSKLATYRVLLPFITYKLQSSSWYATFLYIFYSSNYIIVCTKSNFKFDDDADALTLKKTGNQYHM